MNLENSIKDCITKELEKGIVEKVIADKLEECISSALKDMFSWGGEVKKVIEGKVKSVMIPYLENYDYSEYISKLDSVLIDVLKNSSLENKVLLENFKELMTSETLPREIKITQIYDRWCEYCKKKIDTDKVDMYDYEGGHINVTLNVEEVSSDWSDFEKHIVRFECEEDEDLNAEFMLTRWKKYDNYHRLDWNKASDLSSLRGLKEFDMYMMKLNQAYVKIQIDDECSSDEIFIEPEE
jgi:predicted Holliday junction resolvase-like endonuclease